MLFRPSSDAVPTLDDPSDDQLPSLAPDDSRMCSNTQPKSARASCHACRYANNNSSGRRLLMEQPRPTTLLPHLRQALLQYSLQSQ